MSIQQRDRLPVREIDMSASPFESDVKSIFSNMLLPDLKKAANPLIETLRRFQYKSTGKPNAAEPAQISVMRTNGAKKADYVAFMLLFFKPNNVHYYMSALPARLRKLFYAIAEAHYLDGAAAESIYGEKIIKTNSYWRSELVGELEPFLLVKRIVYIYGKHEPYFVFFRDDSLCTLFLTAQYHEQGRVKPVLDGLSIYNGENSIFQELPFIASLYESGQLKVGSTKLRTKSFEKAVSKIEMTDFNIQSSDEWAGFCSRRYFVPILFAEYADEMGYDNRQPSEELIADIAGFDDELDIFFYKTFLPHIKGLTQGKVSMLDVDFFCKKLYNVFCENDFDEWTSVYDVCQLLRIAPAELTDPESEYMLFDYYDLDRLRLENTCTGKHISFTEQVYQVSDAVVKSVLYALASWGVFEIAYEPTMPKGATSPFDALHYVRFTNLGRYVYGKITDYTPPVTVAQDNPFQLADDRLLIKVLNPQSPRLLLLDQFAIRVATTLYKVDEKIFLHEVSTKSELEIKIKLFKRTFGKELPSLWNDFFNDLLMRCDAFTTPSKSYVIRRINKADRRLQEIILSDSRLKSYVVRAEGYLILIERSHVDEFDKIMREYGYIM